MQKIDVGLVQIGDSFGENQYYLPYALGLLEAYAKAHLKDKNRFNFKLPIFKRDKISNILDSLLDSDIVFFSSYLWNFQISLRVAKELKCKNPNIKIAFGGPQVPENSEKLQKFATDYPFIDFCCFGEGERVFLRLLENFQRDLSIVPSIGYLKDREFIKNETTERISDLNEVPSPYLEGVFDKLIELNPEINWSVMWETNRGCPFSCAFCAWGATNKRRVYKYEMDKLFNEIDWFSKNKIEFIFCCDANYGMFERDFEIAKRVAQNKKKYGYPMVFSIQNTKNTTDKIFELQKLLNDNDLQRGVNLALQSTNPQTLKSISRKNISSDVYNDLQKMFTDEKIATFSDIILGLPDESYESFVAGVENTISNGQHNRIQFINLTILENTQMSEPEYIKKHGLILQKSKIVAHHTTIDEQDEVLEEQDIVVGSRALPREDWVKTRVFCWLTSILHFNKVLQIVFIVINRVADIAFSDLIELFIIEDKKYPILSEIYKTLKAKAVDIQNGENEFVFSKEYLNIYWPVDEFVFIELIYKDRLDEFYKEVEGRFLEFFESRNTIFPVEILRDSLKLNRELIKIPFKNEKLELELSYNIFDLYLAILVGKNIELTEQKSIYKIDRESQKWSSWSEWFKEVVWFGTKRGDYLYKVIK